MGTFPLLGLDKDAWDKRNQDDLIAIKPRSTPDTLSRWLTEKLVPAYHHVLGKKFKVPTSLFKDPLTTLTTPETSTRGNRCRHISLQRIGIEDRPPYRYYRSRVAPSTRLNNHPLYRPVQRNSTRSNRHFLHALLSCSCRHDKCKTDRSLRCNGRVSIKNPKAEC